MLAVPGSGAQHVPAALVGAPQDAAPHQDAGNIELQQGIELTRNAQFAEAIPHLGRAVRGGAEEYPSVFNLALCYVGTGQYDAALTQLRDLQKDGYNTAAVNNLLAQTYLGKTQSEEAWAAIREAARLAPLDEQMYALLADACTDHYDYGLGLKVAELGLQSLPASARLHYERAVFLARLDRLDEAKPEFAKAAKLGFGSDVGTLAAVQASLYDDRFDAAAATARAAIASGHRSAQMLTLLGDVLLQGGAVPGESGFEEARKALEAAVAEQPGSSTAQIGLGTLYLRENHAAEALPHLLIGQRMEPDNSAVYMKLATAYRKLANQTAARECMQRLGELLKERQAAELRRIQEKNATATAVLPH